ncbi:MAG: hypothetical protein J0L99_17385 [Chitinophagales bacterium]|nr:hypothetical protein [Chitinophagales bacterium]
MKQVLIFTLIVLCCPALAQTPLAGRALHFQTIHARDTIDFIVAHWREVMHSFIAWTAL